MLITTPHMTNPVAPNKAQLKNALLNSLVAELELARLAADQAKSSATSSEAKSENKYDTRSAEAAYLAHGQSLRAQILQGLITQIDQWAPGADHQVIRLGSLVCFRSTGDQPLDRWVWITPIGARQIRLGGLKVQVLNASASLADQLIGFMVGDTVALMKTSCSITSVT